MKTLITWKIVRGPCLVWILVLWAMGFGTAAVYAQDTAQAATAVAQKPKPTVVKNTFESIWIIDNQTVMVPVKGTFEMDILHRFGVWENGYEDFFGLFASSNIRIGASYAPINKLNVGVGITKYKMMWDANVKYAIIEQMSSGRWPVSITYYGNAAIDSRSSDNFQNFSDRLTYFNQIIIARKITPKFSAQVAPSLSHTNVVNGYYSEPGKVSEERNHNHFAVAVSGRYKLKESMAIIANYDQPITKHKAGNPHPNISLGLEISTSAHAFQFFAGNYYYLSPQQNNMYNTNDFTKGEFLIGFNITRLWNY
ncbi:DUF5777 family beta-barrel protein [Flavihumibacter solisilvae]|uniref:DUF5777 family beta-barrel protein n=1 Tax=Flavihumibacter solisilvae TaxID=1349421 RepID=UPI00126A7348|nr:DUF5777 family beta-barrel protein [Flavihumibacter solisilvae]